jgi:hypothetical protein
MRLTRYQRWILALYGRHRGGPLPATSLLRQGLPAYVLAVCSLGGCAMLAYLIGWPSVALVLLGIPLGAFWREVDGLRELRRIWPVYREIIAWERVEGLLVGEDHQRATPDEPL